MRINSTSTFENMLLLFPYDQWLATLDGMLLHSSHRTKGLLAGKRRSSSLGSSLEFADYRAYIPGDDIRRIDWNLYGRTTKAYIRQYWDEQERSFSIYVDGSKSMTAIGEAEQNKWLFALRLAASVGYLAIQGEDRVAISVFDELKVTNHSEPLFGKSATFTLIERLAGWIRDRNQDIDHFGQIADPIGYTVQQSSLSQPFANTDKLPRRAGVTWVFSDGLYEDGLEQLLIQLMSRKQQVVFVHVLHDFELQPQLDGEWRLVDIETGAYKEVAMSPQIIDKYARGVRFFQEQLKEKLESRGMIYYSVNSSKSLPSQFMSMLTSGGQLQYR